MENPERTLIKVVWNLGRERFKVESKEKKLIADIKKAAKDNQMDTVKIMAKELVRTRRYLKKCILMRANIRALIIKVETIDSEKDLAQAMKGVPRALRSFNIELSELQYQHPLEQFDLQSLIMKVKEDMMNEVIDDAMGHEDAEEETDAVVTRILDELGVQLNQQLSDLPSTGGSFSVAAASCGRCSCCHF